uniref:Uncharacterized protein n=1 Tax=Peronospora matthiolae TaxID=2874970 RepID=A0AAV1V489_9STRA
MSPIKRVGGAAEPAAHTVVVDDHHLEEKSAVPSEAIEKMLAMLGDLSERMNRMEVSQREQGGKNWQGSPESSIASRQQEVEAGINLQTLDRTPPKESPNVSPATYCVGTFNTCLLFSATTTGRC